MEYRPFGKTGVQVSIMGYGAMRLPTLEDGTCDVEKSLPLLRRGIDLGINYIDTAYVYIKGTSEVAVGQAIKGYDRESLYLATKIPVHGEDDAQPDVWRGKLEESLRRFSTGCGGTSSGNTCLNPGWRWTRHAMHRRRGWCDTSASPATIQRRT